MHLSLSSACSKLCTWHVMSPLVEGRELKPVICTPTRIYKAAHITEREGERGVRSYNTTQHTYIYIFKSISIYVYPYPYKSIP